MNKILVIAVFSATVLMSCKDGITYSSCTVKTTSDVANSLIPGGERCYNVDGGGFLLKSDAVSWCEDEVPESFKAINGISDVDLIFEANRSECETDEE